MATEAMGRSRTDALDARRRQVRRTAWMSGVFWVRNWSKSRASRPNKGSNASHFTAARIRSRSSSGRSSRVVPVLAGMFCASDGVDPVDGKFS